MKRNRLASLPVLCVAVSGRKHECTYQGTCHERLQKYHTYVLLEIAADMGVIQQLLHDMLFCIGAVM